MLARSVSFLIAGRVGALAIGFVASIVVARLLGPADRGVLALITFAVGLVFILAGLGLPQAVVFLASKREARRGALLGNSIAWGVLLAAICIPGFWLLSGLLAQAFSKGSGQTAWAVAGLLVPLTFLDWSIHNQLYGKLRFGLLNVLIVVSRLVALASVLVLVGLLDLGVSGALLANVAAAVFMIAGSLAVILSEARPRLDGAVFRTMLSYGARVAVGSIFGIATARVDLLVLQFYAPLSSVGYYVVAQMVAELALLVALPFQESLTTLSSRYEGEERQDRMTITALRHQGVLTGLMIGANAVLGSIVILLAYGPEYRPALAPMLILLPGMWFLATAGVVAGDLRGRGRPGASSALAGVTVVVMLALDLALIPSFGVVGAAMASLIAYTFYGLLSLSFLSRVVNMPVRMLVAPTRAEFGDYKRFWGRTVGRYFSSSR
jgi:O-antigen/teichoic acid export membrane protein